MYVYPDLLMGNTLCLSWPAATLSGLLPQCHSGPVSGCQDVSWKQLTRVDTLTAACALSLGRRRFIANRKTCAKKQPDTRRRVGR